jgi:hypothetical protein
MGYAVELYFDAETEHRVRAIWESMDEFGVGESLQRAGFAPHVSLAVCPDADADALYTALGAWASQRAPVEVTLSSAGVFPGDRPVIFLAPVPNAELIQTHAQLLALLDRHSVEVVYDYRVGNWVPHCTVATDLVNFRVGEAIDLARARLPLSSRLIRVGISTFRPARVVYDFALAPADT